LRSFYSCNNRARAADVEVVPVPGDPVPEVGFGAEGFPVGELIFDEAVNGLDIALPGVGFDRDVVVSGAQIADGGGQAAMVLIFEELRAMVGLPLDAAQGDPMEGQVGADVLGQESGIGLAKFVGIAGEGLAAEDFADSVL